MDMREGGASSEQAGLAMVAQAPTVADALTYLAVLLQLSGVFPEAGNETVEKAVQ
jgi:hypothetical protein